MRGLESTLLGGIALLALGLAGLGSFHYGYGPMVIAFPLGLAAVLVGLCLLRAAQAARRADAGADRAAVEPPGWPAVIWIAAAPLSVLLFGFALGLALFGAAFARGHGARLRIALPLGIGVLVAIEVLFASLLGLTGTGLPGWWPEEIRSALPEGLVR